MHMCVAAVAYKGLSAGLVAWTGCSIRDSFAEGALSQLYTNLKTKAASVCAAMASGLALQLPVTPISLAFAGANAKPGSTAFY